MPQTTYDEAPLKGFAGLGARDVPGGVRTVINEESSALPYGIGVKRGSDARGCAEFDAVTDEFYGVLMHKHRDPGADGQVDGLEADAYGPCMQAGDIWVRCEEAIALGDRVFCRATAPGSETVGAFRNDADGDAQVTTVTPTPANDTDYTLNVFAGGKLYSFSITSDASATATEICDDFRTEMQGDSEFDALVTSSGTDTLILTSADSSKEFQVNAAGSEGALAIAETTAAAPECFELEHAEWMTASSTGADGETTALLRLNRP